MATMQTIITREPSSGLRAKTGKIREMMPKDGKNGDVHLGVPEKPEQMLPQQGRAAHVRLQAIPHQQAAGNKKAGARQTVENQQQAGRKQYGEGNQAHHGGNQPGPDGHGQPGQSHALGAHIQDGGDEIHGAQDLRDAKKKRRPTGSTGVCPRASPGPESPPTAHTGG